MAKQNKYLSSNIIKGTREGHNTRKGSPRNHVYKVMIGKYLYWRFVIHRSGKLYSKYFKQRKEAHEFRQILEIVKDYKVASYLKDNDLIKSLKFYA